MGMVGIIASKIHIFVVTIFFWGWVTKINKWKRKLEETLISMHLRHRLGTGYDMPCKLVLDKTSFKTKRIGRKGFTKEKVKKGSIELMGVCLKKGVPPSNFVCTWKKWFDTYNKSKYVIYWDILRYMKIQKM